MELAKGIQVIDTHTMGEPTRIIVGGIPKIEGGSLAEKRDYLANHLDYIRTATMLEPRGHKDMFGCILTEPVNPTADLGVIFMDGTGYLNMCGHSIIGVAAAAVQTGIVAVKEPYTEIMIETCAGLVNSRVKVENNKVKEVSFINVPAFVYQRNMTIDLPSLGAVTFDIAFGGNFIAVIKAEELGVELEPKNIGSLTRLALTLRQLVNEKITVQHPEKDYIRSVDTVEIYGPPKASGAYNRNVVIFGDGQFDRSPCGTGTAVKMAILFDDKKLRVGDSFINESITGTLYKGQILSETKVGEHQAIITEITGNAYITGYNSLVLDEDDPLRFGVTFS